MSQHNQYNQHNQHNQNNQNNQHNQNNQNLNNFYMGMNLFVPNAVGNTNVIIIILTIINVYIN